MASFSERNGFKQPRALVQRDDLDAETRMAIWNVLSTIPVTYESKSAYAADRSMAGWLWREHFGRARDETPSSGQVWQYVKNSVLADDFADAMDTIEAVVFGFANHPISGNPEWSEAHNRALNDTLEDFLVGYRLIGAQLIPLDSAEEVQSVTEALETTASVAAAARAQLAQALTLLSDRANPDYRNSIKESISAVESVARQITGEKTLGAAVRALPRAGVQSHQALLNAWSSMYGWTSDEGGLRHGGAEVADVDQALAKYVLVISSAFVTYLLEEARKSGLL